MAKAADPTPTQEQPTRPREVSPDGRTLDRWGLPLGGPARAAALAGKADPEIDPAGWGDAPAAELLLTEPAPALVAPIQE